ncbi:MAG: hypothetical protein GVY32_06835 [Gammaproteobacteria bacterium]|jgi:hypothetical protein|nr:hypothetical protein [Gammaproteobacteria bacterium]
MLRPYALVFAALGFASIPSALPAATWTVCPSGCDSTTIQGAISQAAAGDTIELLSSLPHTEFDISVNKDVTIQGQGVDNTTIQAASAPNTAPARVFWIFPNTTATIRDLQIRYGYFQGTGGGGCLLNEGNLTLRRVELLECKAAGPKPGDAVGGGVRNVGDLSLQDVLIESSSSSLGGGIHNSGTLVSENCTLKGNTASEGGNMVNQATAFLTSCTISGSQISQGILNQGELSLIDSRISDNDDASIESSGSLTVLRSRVETTFGYGIFIHSTSEQTWIQDSLIHDSEAGGIFFCGNEPGRIVNSTISGNRTTEDGGGIYVCASKSLQIASSTIANNTADHDGDGSGDGGGIYLEPPSDCNPFCVSTTVELRNSIVADNIDGSPSGNPQAEDCSGTLQSDGYNLIENASTSGPLAPCLVAGDTSGVILGSDPQLGPLQDNFGPTHTHALQPGSPAIDAGDPGGCTDFDGNPVEHDQRGAPRIGTCDLGAFEFGSGPPIFGDRFEQ